MPKTRVDGLKASAARVALNSAAEIFDDGFGTGMDVQLFVDVPNVAVKCAVADAEVVDDFLVAKSFRELVEHFHLARSKFLEFGGRLRHLAKILHDATRDLRSHGRAARMRLADGLCQFRGGSSFQQVAARAGSE